MKVTGRDFWNVVYARKSASLLYIFFCEELL